jgi:hypothetical protein
VSYTLDAPVPDRPRLLISEIVAAALAAAFPVGCGNHAADVADGAAPVGAEVDASSAIRDAAVPVTDATGGPDAQLDAGVEPTTCDAGPPIPISESTPPSDAGPEQRRLLAALRERLPSGELGYAA